MDADNQSVRRGLPADQVALAVEVFRMLADGTRIQILWALIDGEMPVNELAATIGKPGPGVARCRWVPAGRRVSSGRRSARPRQGAGPISASSVAKTALLSGLVWRSGRLA